MASASGTTGYRHRYGLGEFIEVYALALRALPVMRRNRVRHDLSPAFTERIMLAVTEVNGCEVCSYAHAKYALTQGLDNVEISALLSGDDAVIPPAEAKAILFAQHYADRNGRPDRDAYDRLREEYGDAKTTVIVAAIQLMMLGNVLGLPLSALLSRLKGTRYPNSPLWYEAVTLPAPVALLPFAVVRALASGPRLPERIRFSGAESRPDPESGDAGKGDHRAGSWGTTDH